MQKKPFSLQWFGPEEKKAVANICERIVHAAGDRIEQAAKAKVQKKSRKLEKSIKARPWHTKTIYGCAVEAGEEGQEHVARFVELGTPGDEYKQGKRRGKKRTPIEPKPYLRPALKQEEGRFIKSFERAL